MKNALITGITGQFLSGRASAGEGIQCLWNYEKKKRCRLRQCGAY